MVQYVITPWRDRAELLTVRGQLYSPVKSSLDDSDRQYAVEKISVWVQRGNCPHLVESTAILTSAKLNDVPRNSNYCIRAAYSAAFARFVTGLLDGHQDKRRKLSMYSIAKTIGLPATFVELRHQATHEELPSLPKLRTATEKALRWIWEYYWAQLSADRPIPQDCQGYLEGMLNDKKEHTDNDLKGWASQWGDDQIRMALVDISKTTTDAEILLESLRLSSKFMMKSVESSIDESVEEAEVRSLEEVKAHLTKMAEEISGSEEEVSSKAEVPSDLDKDMETEGWTLWKGPWTPTPIGTIC